MEEAYNQSLQKIKELLEIPTEKEWNVIAKLEGYLFAETMKYISGESFIELCKRVRES